MTELLQETEAEPSSYPAEPSGLSTEAQALDSDALWQRIEGYLAYRFTIRSVTWVVEGPGWFVPPLKPATLGTTEVWNGEAWESVTLDEAPIGQCLNERIYKIQASVGQTTVPAAVNEAYRRLAEYLADETHIDGAATSGTKSLGDSLSVTAERPATWHAKALQYSGAADLLRPWRRAC